MCVVYVVSWIVICLKTISSQIQAGRVKTFLSAWMADHNDDFIAVGSFTSFFVFLKFQMDVTDNLVLILDATQTISSKAGF